MADSYSNSTILECVYSVNNITIHIISVRLCKMMYMFQSVCRYYQLFCGATVCMEKEKITSASFYCNSIV